MNTQLPLNLLKDHYKTFHLFKEAGTNLAALSLNCHL